MFKPKMYANWTKAALDTFYMANDIEQWLLKNCQSSFKTTVISYLDLLHYI